MSRRCSAAAVDSVCGPAAFLVAVAFLTLVFLAATFFAASADCFPSFAGAASPPSVDETLSETDRINVSIREILDEQTTDWASSSPWSSSRTSCCPTA